MATRAAGGLLMRVSRVQLNAAPRAAAVSSRLARSSSSSSSSSLSKSSVESSLASTSSSTVALHLPSPLEPALVHPRTHSHHVATLQLRAYGPGRTLENLTFFTDFALRAGYALGIPLSRPASLPVRTSLWTVPKGPFVHKKSQENFERRTHKRVIKVWDADAQVVDRWLEFLRIHAMAGVGMRAELVRHLPLSVGSRMIASARSQLRDSRPTQSAGTGALQEANEATVRASEADGEAVARLAQNIVEQEMAKQDAEADNVERLPPLREESKEEDTGKDSDHREASS